MQKLKTAPTVEPVTLAEVKQHCNISNSIDDAYLDALISASRQTVEDVCRIALLPQTWIQKVDCFEDIRMTRFPFSSVTSIKYLDTDNVEQTLDSSLYRVIESNFYAGIEVAYNQTFPDVLPVSNAVTVEYVAGYAKASDVPKSIKQAIFLLIGHFYENREATSPINMNEMPLGVPALLSPYIGYAI